MTGRAAIVVAGLGLVALTGCGSVKGERVLVDDGGASFGTEEIAAATDADDTAPTDPSAPAGEEVAGPTVTTTTALPAVVEVAESEPVPAAFAFSAVSLSGDEIAGSDLFDRAPAILTFVRADCDYSEEEVPKIAEAARRHDDVTFVIVASGEGGPDVPWLDGIGEGQDNIVVLDDRDDRLWYRFAMTGTPSNVLVDDAGLMRSSYGALAESGLDRASRAVTDGFA